MKRIQKNPHSKHSTVHYAFVVCLLVLFSVQSYAQEKTTFKDTIYVYFDTDKDLVKDQFKQKIEEIKDSFNGFSLTSIILAGHTDSRASEEYNDTLSHKRTKAVLKELNKIGLSKDGTFL